METIVALALLLSTSVWIGGLVVIAVVAQVARRELEPGQRVVFFRALGRTYAPVGSLGLGVALLAGAAEGVWHGWTDLMTLAAGIAVVLVVVTAGGVRQARRMSRLREAALDSGRPADADRVRRGARQASLLRGLIALLSMVLLGLGAAIVT